MSHPLENLEKESQAARATLRATFIKKLLELKGTKTNFNIKTSMTLIYFEHILGSDNILFNFTCIVHCRSNLRNLKNILSIDPRKLYCWSTT